MARTPASEERISAPSADGGSARTRWPIWLELGKAPLSGLVVLTAAAGFVLAERGSIEWGRLAWTILGTALAALGANAFNQWSEAERDARMERTCRRPLPQRRIGRPAAFVFALLASVGGPVLLAMTVNLLAAGLAAVAAGIHVLVYTPMKARTPLNTLAGAVVGALPPLVGWTAAAGVIETGGWLLAGVLFLWQVPHFLALAWIYRDDYARGGFRMLPAVDPGGHLTGLLAVMYTLALVPLTLVLALVGMAGWVYAVGAIVLGGGLLLVGIALERHRTNAAARRLFVASVVYLPLLLGLMVLDR